MRIHSLLGASVLLAGLLMSACDSSSTSPTPNPEKPATQPLKPSGTLTIAGKAWPVWVAGGYNKDSLGLVIKTDLDVIGHTGWGFALYTLPGQGTRAIEKDTLVVPQNTASYWSNPNQPADCTYRVNGGNFHIDAWTATSTGTNETVKMSGGASIILIPYEYTSKDCKGFTAEVTFTDADAEFTHAVAKTAAQ